MPTLHKRLLLYACITFLFITPFFWLKPGQMDIGGDSSRLYFYDPIHYLNAPLYIVAPNGIGSESTAYILIPFILLLVGLKTVLFSPYLLITLFNSFTLVLAFLSIYGIVTALLKNSQSTADEDVQSALAGILAGLFYIFSPILSQPGWWANALFAHNQFFLNPLIFFLFLKYILSKHFRYILIAVATSFLFTPNFFLGPYFFSFYPLAFFYIICFALIVKRTKLKLKELIGGGLLYLFVHSFHLFPMIKSTFSSGSGLNTLVFADIGRVDRSLTYFLSVESVTKIVNSLFTLPQGDMTSLPLYFLWVCIPILLVFGLVLAQGVFNTNEERRKTLLLLLFFFLLTFYLVSAKITYIGSQFYIGLFNIPGFHMFRNYVGQFSHTFIFFYCLIFGFSLFYIFSFLKTTTLKFTLFAILLILFLVSNIPFIGGNGIHTVLNAGGKKEVTAPMRMDPGYEEFLAYVRDNPIDGKYLTLPLDDAGNQVLAGSDGGAYVGPAMIGYLTGKNEFAGSKSFIPFDNLLFDLLLQKDYVAIQNLLSLFNIKYIFYNSDPGIYDDTFPSYPYSYVRKFTPYIQTLYQDFLNQLALEKERDFGDKYHLYKVKSSLPHIYIAKEVIAVNKQSPDAIIKAISLNSIDKRIAIVDEKIAQTLGIAQDTLIAAEKQNTFLETFSKQQDTQVVTANVSPQIAQLLGPLLILRQKIQNAVYITDQDLDMDKAVYSAERKLRGGDEKALTDYKNIMLDLIDYLEKQNNKIYSPLMKKVKLAEIFAQDEKDFEVSIKQSTRTDGQKRILYSLSNEMFISLAQRLHTSIPRFENVTYTFEIPQKGTYQATVEKKTFEPIEYEKLKVLTRDKNMPSNLYQPEDYWLTFGNTFMENKGKENFFLFSPPSSYPFDQTLLSAGKEKEATFSAKLVVKDSAIAYFKEIVNYLSYWVPNTTYFITLEYRTTTSSLLQGKQPSTIWNTYKAILETDDKGTSAILLIVQDKNALPLSMEDINNPVAVEVKNLSIIRVPTPTVLLRKINEQKTKESSTPKIIFTKINPTRYEVELLGADKPYMLTFLDSFNDNWKIYLKESKDTLENKDKIIESYFAGEVNQADFNTVFFAPSFLETWGSKPIAATKHYVTNGYANLWYIEPQDTNGKTNYTLVLEMTSQRSLYKLLLLSLITSVVCVLGVAGSFIKHDKKTK